MTQSPLLGSPPPGIYDRPRLAIAPETPPEDRRDAAPEQSGRPSQRRTVDELEHAFQAGADDALRRAYDTYGSLVFTFCSRTLGHAAAVDATQEVFISAWRSQARFDPEKGSLAAWLMTIAKRRCIDQLRHDGRRPQVTGADPELAAAAPTTAADTDIDAVERLADRMLVTEALEQLGGRSRQSVEMAFFEQLTHSEIATRTGQPIGTVKSDIRRGLARLRQFLEHQDA